MFLNREVPAGKNPKKKLDVKKNAFGKATGFVTLRVDALSVPCASHHPHRSDIGKDLSEVRTWGEGSVDANGKGPGGMDPKRFCRFK